jgi:hypothetical protein
MKINISECIDLSINNLFKTDQYLMFIFYLIITLWLIVIQKNNNLGSTNLHHCKQYSFVVNVISLN